MHKLEAIKFLEARLAAIEREHNDEFASEGTRSEADARAEAKALAAIYDFLKDCKIARAEFADSVSVGFQIVEDAHLRNRKLFLDLAGIHTPREICRLGTALFHWTWHAKARSDDVTFLIL